ncbi:MAG: nucleotidyltransferase domain-containing protein [Candidatus Hodarchaeales archaeon]|jgi:hypothetical protein
MNQFDLLLKISKLMKDFNKPWYIAGGWAIDLFLGLVTRSHQDIEITVQKLLLKEAFKDA